MESAETTEERVPLTGPPPGADTAPRRPAAAQPPGRANAVYAFVAGLLLLFSALVLLPGGLARLSPRRPPPPPPAASAAGAMEGLYGAVAADDERCSRLGVHVLQNINGSAADAAVAALLCQGAVAPYASGIGGGALLLAYAPDKPPVFLDARETAPAGTDPAAYEADARKSLFGGGAVGVPGEVRGLHALHEKFGKLNWTDVVELAVPFAEESVVSEQFQHQLERFEYVVRNSTDLIALLRREEPAGQSSGSDPPLLRAGDKFRNPALATTLRAVAKLGPYALYNGLATNISARVRATGGVMTAADIRGYQAGTKSPLQSTYRTQTVLGAGLPSAGGASVAMALNILEGVLLPKRGRTSSSYKYIVEALKWAFGWRMRLGDPAFAIGAARAVRQMIDKGLARRLERRIDVSRTYPPRHYARRLEGIPDDHGTTHVGVVDKDGMAVSATSTINVGFGSGVVAAGIILNNQMDDFSSSSSRANFFGLYPSAANRIQPGKRPLSSMSPTIVLRGGQVSLVVGGSGGPRIISATLLATLNVLDWGDAVADAVAAPRLHHQLVPNAVVLERLNVTSCANAKHPPGRPGDKAGRPYWKPVCAALKEAGHEVRGPEAIGVVQAVFVTPAGNEPEQKRRVFAASDGRKGGRAAAY